MKEKIALLLLLLLLAGCSRNGISTELTQDENVQPRIHSDFDITQDKMESFVAYQPDEIKTAILNNPERFLDLAELMLNEDPDLFFLVDKQHSLASDFIPENLVNLDDISIIKKNKKGLQISQIVLATLMEMNKDAIDSGLSLLVSSTYRSYVYQVKTYNYWVDQLGKEEADRVSAYPGKSQHQLGLAIDFGSIDESYEFTPEGAWQLENAWKYGWSLSFPKGQEDFTGYAYECWHYRYIGKAAAQMEKEFFNSMQQGLLLFWNENKESLSGMYSKEVKA